MKSIREAENKLVLENNLVSITLSKTDASVLEIIEKASSLDIKNGDAHFFEFIDVDKESIIAPSALSLKDNVITVLTHKGSFDIKVEICDEYFIFELVSELPCDIFRLHIANTSFNCDCNNKSNMGLIGLALTYWIDPSYYPDAKSGKTFGVVYPHLRHTNARYALVAAPIKEHKRLIKQIYLKIDRNDGIMSEIGGAWGRDSRLNFGNYIIEFESDKNYIADNIPFYKSIGVDQIDFHQYTATMRQGDFKFERYNDAEEFKKFVTEPLAQNGMSAGLHTYSHYIRYDCDAILSKPEYQADLGVLEEFTLAADISETADFLPTVESTENVSKNYTFFSRNTPFILIGNEIIKFINAPDGFKVEERGVAGTKAVKHSKGETIKHIEGYYYGICPKLGSNLFLQIARNTADAFNRGGFKMIYLDALDGMSKHCEIHEYWYYTAMFVCEILKHCKTYPLIEYSTIMPSLWAARGRIGAWDTPYRGYKGWNQKHADSNKTFIDRYSAPTLGWYDFYPQTDKYPGNEHTKYHHTDSIEHMGSLAVMYDFSTVFNGPTKSIVNRYSALKRNIELYKKYDALRKSEYFSEDLRQKLIDGKWEYHLKKKSNGNWAFLQKDYQSARIYDLNSTERNFANFQNPFNAQKPFIRIEAFLSTAKNNPLLLIGFDETKDLSEQPCSRTFEKELDLTDRLAKIVKVKGNGKKGGKIAIIIDCATNSEVGYGQYIIDTDFEGWREFILLETDNGERCDHPFEDGRWHYAVYRSSLNNSRITKISVLTDGDVQGVRLSDIVSYEHTYEVLKNPTVTVGEQSVMFECELMSSDFIEFDGKNATVTDRYGNQKKIWFDGGIKVKKGDFTASLSATPLNRNTPRAQLTFGFTGKEIK